MAETTRLMNAISPRLIAYDELTVYARHVRHRLALDPVDIHEYALALEIVDRLLGREWVRRIIDPRMSADPYLGAFHQKGLDHVRHKGRLIHLAETMFNLQSVPGFFPQRLIALRSDPHGVEAADLELLAGRWLMRAGVQFEYACGRARGTAYEIDFRLSATTYPLEVKLKRESTVCSVRTIKDSLETARTQLPKGREGVVLLGIPETWTALSTNEGIIREAVHARLRQTKRIAAVVVVWPETHLSVDGGTVAFRFRTLRNEQVSLAADAEHLLANFERDPRDSWTTLRSIATASL